MEKDDIVPAHYGYSRNQSGYCVTGTPDAKSDSRILGVVGRLDAGWHGFVHLCARAGAFAARSASPLRHSRNEGQHWLLRRSALLAVPRGMGIGISLGTRWRQVRARAHPDDY